MIKNIVFDLGGVLIDWNPRYVFRQVFDTDKDMEYFLTEICNMAWNEQQDGGHLIADGTEELIAKHPTHEKNIRRYYDEWQDMLAGPIYQTVDILQNIHLAKIHKLYALTNWSGELFPVARQRYEFLRIFRGIIVSGDEKLQKPDPAIYQLLLDRYNIKAEESLFIDDNLRNIEAADKMGIQVIHFLHPTQLREELLERFGIST